jgi:hypothetical protein
LLAIGRFRTTPKLLRTFIQAEPKSMPMTLAAAVEAAARATTTWRPFMELCWASALKTLPPGGAQ